MFRSIIIILTLAVMAIATKNPNYCYPDGCKRTLEKLQGGIAKCQVDLGCEVTPAAVVRPARKPKTIYSGVATITVTREVHAASPVTAVTTCTTASVPQYLAESCEFKAASYTSACSCIGAPGTTKTFPTPTVFAAVTVVIPKSTTTSTVDK
jgi:hypothetical protein